MPTCLETWITFMRILLYPPYRFFINRTMNSSSSRSLKQLSSNPRGLAFFLGPKLAARSPLKPFKDFPVITAAVFFILLKDLYFPLATVLSRLNKIYMPRIAPMIHFKHHSWSRCLEFLNPVKEFQKPFETKQNSYLTCHMQRESTQLVSRANC